MEKAISHYLGDLAAFWKVDLNVLQGFMKELHGSTEFLAEINTLIAPVAEFKNVQFDSVERMRAYRCFLYLAARVRQPDLVVETGVHNGMGSAFILLALKHNRHGELISIDLPNVDDRILDQGTNPLPVGRAPGWCIPDSLRDRHSLLLGKAELLLPEALAKRKQVDLFVHDSDHSYSHIMFEMGLVWAYLSHKGYAIVDNIEQNNAFEDFVKGVGARSYVVSTFDGPDRTWRHGMVAKD